MHHKREVGGGKKIDDCNFFRFYFLKETNRKKEASNIIISLIKLTLYVVNFENKKEEEKVVNIYIAKKCV